MGCSVDADTSQIKTRPRYREYAGPGSGLRVQVRRVQSVNAALTSLCLIKDPLGFYKCFEESDAVLIETYDQARPMVRG